jgi:AcrR family transcriptional regulator
MMDGNIHPTGSKRERTRARLIEAAAEVIGRNGLEATSLEAIALHAGMSRGAIYGNFRDKEELFLAVAMSRWTPVVTPPGPPKESLRDRMRRHGQAVADAAEARRAEAVGATSFVQYALRNETLRQRVEAVNESIYADAARGIVDRGDSALRMDVHVFVRTVHALTEGCIILHALSPRLMTRETIVAAFEGLA